MSTTDETTRWEFAGDGATETFADATAMVRANTDIGVSYITDTTGVEVVKVLTTDYTVTIADDFIGFTVDTTNGTTATSLETVAVYRTQPLTHVPKYENFNGSPAATYDNDFDKATHADLTLQEQIDRTLRVHRGHLDADLPLTPLNMTDKAGDVVRVNATEDDFELFTDPSLGSLPSTHGDNLLIKSDGVDTSDFQITGISVSDADLLTAAAITATGAGIIGGELKIENASPDLLISETGLAADTGKWILSSDAGRLSVKPLSDDQATAGTCVIFDRTGTTGDSVTISATRFFMNGGTAAAPGVADTTDQDTGWAWLGTDVLVGSTGGTEAVRFDISQDATFAGVAYIADGAVDTPAYNFTSETDSGMYIKSAGVLCFATEGIEVMCCDADQNVTINNNLTVGGIIISGGGTTTFPDGTAAAPSITFTDDLDTGLYRKGTNNVGIAAGGIEVMAIGTTETVINDTGAVTDFRFEGDTLTHLWFAKGSTDRIGINTATPGALLDVAGTTHISGSTSQLLLRGTGSTIDVGGVSSTPIAYVHNEDDSSGGYGTSSYTDTAGFLGAGFFVSRSRGTQASPTVVVDNNILGLMSFLGHDGTDYHPAATIRVQIDGTPGDGDMPGEMFFATNPGGTSLVDALKIGVAGDVEVIVGDLTVTAGDLNVIGVTKLGVAETALGTLHVETATSGSIAPNSAADDLIVENDTHTGISVYSGTTSLGFLVFASADDDLAGQVKYNHNSDEMTFFTAATERIAVDSGGDVEIATGDLTVTAGDAEITAGNLGIGITPTELLHINATGATPTLAIERTDGSIVAGNVIAGVEARGGESTVTTVGKFEFEADEAWTSGSDSGTRLIISLAPSGSQTAAEVLRIAMNGDVTIATLAGSGSRTVVASAAGLLSAP